MAKEYRVAKKCDLQVASLYAGCMLSFGSAFAHTLDVAQIRMNLPWPNPSRNSDNIAGMYERDGFSARLAAWLLFNL